MFQRGYSLIAVDRSSGVSNRTSPPPSFNQASFDRLRMSLETYSPEQKYRLMGLFDAYRAHCLSTPELYVFPINGPAVCSFLDVLLEPQKSDFFNDKNRQKFRLILGHFDWMWEKSAEGQGRKPSSFEGFNTLFEKFDNKRRRSPSSMPANMDQARRRWFDTILN